MSAAPKPLTPVQIAAFIKRRWPASRQDTREQLLYWVQWHMDLRQIIVVVDEIGRLCGLALGRFVRDIAEAKTAWANVPDGPIVWVDLVVARRPEVMPAVISELCRRWQGKLWVGGEVFNRNGELRLFRIQQLQRFFGG